MTVASLLYRADRFGESETIFDPDDLDSSHKLLIVHGGEDISPSIYGEKPCVTDATPEPSDRDLIEIATIKRAWELKIPVFGICRGAQLLCAMLGGSLYQDAPHHAGGQHWLILQDGTKLWTNSVHHQMMIPSKEGKVLAHAGKHKARRWKKDTWVTEEIFEPEVVLYQDSRSLAIQGHPEWDYDRANGIYHYTRNLLRDLFKVE